MPKTTKKSVRKTALKKPAKKVTKKTAKRTSRLTAAKVSVTDKEPTTVGAAEQASSDFTYRGPLVGNALEVGNALHNCINDQMRFTATDPATVRVQEINAARYRVRMAVIGMSDAAVNISKNTSLDDVRVLRAKADLAGAEFDRALQAFEQLITG